jgi:hypothetical protein
MCWWNRCNRPRHFAVTEQRSTFVSQEEHMHTLKVLLTAGLAGLLALSLFAPAALAQEAPATGTLTGTVTWGPNGAVAAYTMVGIEGTNITARTDGAGKFTITGVPVGQNFTVDAYSDPTQSEVISRYNVAVGAGEMLDIGSMNLSVAPQEGTPPLEVIPNPNVGNDNMA